MGSHEFLAFVQWDLQKSYIIWSGSFGNRSCFCQQFQYKLLSRSDTDKSIHFLQIGPIPQLTLLKGWMYELSWPIVRFLVNCLSSLIAKDCPPWFWKRLISQWNSNSQLRRSGDGNCTIRPPLVWFKLIEDLLRDKKIWESV